MILSEVSIKRPIFISMIMLALVVFGGISFKQLGVDLFPKVEFPVITIISSLPGADPETVERTVTELIEEAVSSLSSIRHIRSTSAESVSQIIIEFELEKNVDIAYQEVQAKLGTIRKELPHDLKEMVVEKFDIHSAPIMAIVISGKGSTQHLSNIADKRVKERLQQVSGVGQIKIIGKRERNIWIYIDPFKLQGVNVSVQDVINTLKDHHINFPGGRIESGSKEISIKTKAEFLETSDLASAVLAYRNGYPIRVSDVARVVDGVEEPRTLSKLNDEEAIALHIQRQSGTNTVSVAEGIKKELNKLQQELRPEGIKIEVAQDLSIFIADSIDEIQFHLVFGALLAVVIVFLFLWNFRVTFISAFAIPISVISTFILMHVMGFTMNNMTMLALSLSIGILIDDAIVVVENVYRHFKNGKSSQEAASFGTAEIGFAAFGITMSIVAVFVPVAFMKGIVGRFFYQFGLTVTFSVLMSLFVAFSLIPMLSSKLLNSSKEPSNKKSYSELFLSWLDESYRRVLKGALHYRKTTLVLALILLMTSLIFSQFIPAEFIPLEDQSEFYIKVKTPLGSTLKSTDEVIENVRNKIKDREWIAYTFSTIGGDSFGKVNEGVIYVKMLNKAKRSISQLDAMRWTREELSTCLDCKISIEPVPQVSGGGEKYAALQLDIKGENLEHIENISKQLMEFLKLKEGYVDLDISYEKGKPELEISIKRDRAAALQVTPSEIATVIRTLIGGIDINKFRHNGNRYNISLRLDESFRLSKKDVKNLSVRNHKGDLITLGNLIDIEERDGPIQIDRDNRVRLISVYANFEEGKKVLGDAINELTSYIKSVNLAPGYKIEFSGNAEAMEESFRYLIFSLLLAILIVYMVLASLFESFSQPFIIMLALPFSLIGSLGMLFVTQMTLSIFTIIGIIMLMGLVTKNAILLIDYTNTLRYRDGFSTQEAILRAGPVRLRPILMTTFAMIFGMLPIALDHGSSAATRAPMATAIIGGLITSMLLTLIVVPVVYSIADDVVSSLNAFINKIRKYKSARQKTIFPAVPAKES